MSNFQIKVAVEELRKRKLFVAVPMYGGQCSGMFARSMSDLSALCTQYGIQLQLYFLFNESLNIDGGLFNQVKTPVFLL